jgi:hypothetical protein
VESSSRPQQTPAERLTPPPQGRQDVLGTAVLAFREPLAQLTDERPSHTVALEPPNLPSSSSLQAGNWTPSRYLPTWAGKRFLKKSTRLLLVAWRGDGTARRVPRLPL